MPDDALLLPGRTVVSMPDDALALPGRTVMAMPDEASVLPGRAVVPMPDDALALPDRTAGPISMSDTEEAGSNGNASSLNWEVPVPISAGVPNILTEDFGGCPQYLKENSGIIP
jgi:hypothetical protein